MRRDRKGILRTIGLASAAAVIGVGMWMHGEPRRACEQQYGKFRQSFEQVAPQYRGTFYPRHFPPEAEDFERLESLMTYHQQAVNSPAQSPPSGKPLEIKVIELSYLGCPPCWDAMRDAEGKIQREAMLLKNEGVDFTLTFDAYLISRGWDYDRDEFEGFSDVCDDGGRSRVLANTAAEKLDCAGSPSMLIYTNDRYVGRVTGSKAEWGLLKRLRNEPMERK